MKLVIIGIQGAGKSTQGNLLSKQLKIPYLSTGHIFRQIAKEKTALGRYIKETLNAGFLIPDEKTIPIVDEYLSRPEYHYGYILDGFPRTLKQAKKFRNHIDKVIYLDVPAEGALWRIAYRDSEERDDETLPGIKKRIELFYKLTIPVIKYYQDKGKLITVDGTRSIEQVNKEILQYLGKQLVKNQVRSWQQKKKIVLAIIGLPGAGKTETAEYFAKKKLPIIHFGNVINDYIDEKRLSHTEKIHKDLRKKFRKQYGMEAFAKLNLEKISKALNGNSVVVIEGLRSWEEYEFLREKLGGIKIVLLQIWASKETRDERIKNRKKRSEIRGKERDLNEVLGTNMGPTLSLSDYLVVNDRSVEDLHERLEQVYRQIYFS